MTEILRSNVETYRPERSGPGGLLAQVGVHVTVAGALLALVGQLLPWVRLGGGLVSWTGQDLGPVSVVGVLPTLAVAVLALAGCRYLLPPTSATVALGQAILAAAGFFGSVGPVLQVIQLMQVPLLGLFVGLPAGGLVSALGFGVAGVAAWLDRD